LVTQGIAGKIDGQKLEEEMRTARRFFSDREKRLDAAYPEFRAHFPFGVFGCHMCRLYNGNFSVSLF
jgi:hypothetical protein